MSSSMASSGGMFFSKSGTRVSVGASLYLWNHWRYSTTFSRTCVLSRPVFAAKKEQRQNKVRLGNVDDPSRSQAGRGYIWHSRDL